jgi:transposase
LAARRPVPDWRAVHKELKKKHVTLRLVWLEWREDKPDGWGFSQFCWHYSRWLAAQDVVMRLSYPGGEPMFVDFSGDTACWVDADSGEVHKAEVFVAVLGALGMIYAEATRGQDLGSWLSAHMNAWQAYGGVAALTVPDNLKAGVTKACYYDPEVNPSYAELAAHYQTVVLPARAGHPRDYPEDSVIPSIRRRERPPGRVGTIPRDNCRQPTLLALCWFSRGGTGNGCLCQRSGRVRRCSGQRGRVFAFDVVAVPVGVVAG